MKKQSRKTAHAATPKKNTPNPKRWQLFWLPVVAGLSATGLYGFFWLVIRPELIHFAQMPVFFAERRFFLQQLQIPGGFVDYLAAFLTSLYQTGWLGALILAGLVILTFLLLRAVLRPGRWWSVTLLPVLLLVLLQARSSYPVAKTLSLILALEGFLIYRDAFPIKVGFRFGLALPFLFLIYLLSPAAMLLWVLLAALHEILNRFESVPTRILLPLGYVLAGFLIPRIAAGFLFLVPLKDAYFHHALFFQSEKIQIIGAVLCGLVVILAALFFLRKKEGQKPLSTAFNFIQGGVGLVVLGLILYAAFLRTQDERQVLRVRYDAHEGLWKDLAKQVNEKTVDVPLCLFHLNRGLFNTGKMASDFFSIPQRYGRYGLFLHKDLCYQYPLDASDFYFELGHIVEAERWASEAHTLYGETPAVLKRLALVNILQDQPVAAMKFLARLKLNPASRRWAAHYFDCLTEPSRMRSEKQLQKLHALQPKKDFIVMMLEHPEIDLERMLEQFSNNRMAFEYVMANRLIHRGLDGFIDYLKQYPQFVKTPLPRCYEEALIAYLSLKKTGVDSAATQMKIRQSTLDRFRQFEAVLSKYGGNNDAAYDEMSRFFANTYWYYLLYAKPAS